MKSGDELGQEKEPSRLQEEKTKVKERGMSLGQTVYKSCVMSIDDKKVGLQLETKLDEAAAREAVPDRQLFGILLGVCSALLFSLQSAIVEWLSWISPVQLSMFRYIGILTPAVLILAYRHEDPFPRGRRVLLLGLGLFALPCVCLIFYAFQQMPLGDASALVFSSPIFSFLITYVFLGEVFGAIKVVSLVITMAGVVLVSEPPFLFGESGRHPGNEGQNPFFGALSGIVGSFTMAVGYILLRLLKDVHFSVRLLNFSFLPLLVCTAFVWTTGSWQWYFEPSVYSFLFTLSVLSCFANMLLLYSLQHVTAGTAAIARSSDVIFAYTWQFLFFHQSVTPITIVGCLMILTAVCLASLEVTTDDVKQLVSRYFVK